MPAAVTHAHAQSFFAQVLEAVKGRASAPLRLWRHCLMTAALNVFVRRDPGVWAEGTCCAACRTMSTVSHRHGWGGSSRGRRCLAGAHVSEGGRRKAPRLRARACAPDYRHLSYPVLDRRLCLYLLAVRQAHPSMAQRNTSPPLPVLLHGTPPLPPSFPAPPQTSEHRRHLLSRPHCMPP